MKHSIVLLLFVAATLGGCASVAPRLSMQELALAEEEPDVLPGTSAVTPKLVPYPGLTVSYVENGDGEIYYCNERFYCYFDREWFHADSMRGPWIFVEMKYIPGDIFRVRGHLPPTLERQLRG